MARVNHKRVKRLLNEERSKISDRQFFTSRILAGHFEDMAAAQTRRYKYNRRIRVKLIWDPHGGAAITNNLTVQINAGNNIVTRNNGRTERYEIVCGLFAHELGHCLYTDFLAAQTYDKYLKQNKWFPAPPRFSQPGDARREAALWDYSKADPKNNEIIRYIAHEIWNCLEDGYIENRIQNQFPGTLGFSLETLRRQQYESMATLTQIIEKEDDGQIHIFEIILQLILSYMKYGEIKYGDEPLTDERIQTVFKLMPELDDALTNPSGRERSVAVNTILVRCWDYIEDFAEQCKKQQAAAEAAGTGKTLAQTLAETLQSIAGGSEAGEGESSPVPETITKCAVSTSASRAATKALAKTVKESETENAEEPSDSSEEKTAEEEIEESSNDQTESENDEKIGPSDIEGISSEKQKVSSSEQGRIALEQTDSLYEPSGGIVERDEDYTRENYERAAADIERLLDNMAEKAACTALENERTRELNDVAQNISYGNIHSGVNVLVKRISTVDDDLIEQYDEASPPLITISKQIQKSLVQQLKDKRKGGKQTGLMMGRRLDARALCRNDGKVFYKNALPNEIPEMAVALLLDESGSMCSCDRSTYARASAIILYDFCKSLHIPVMVYGHSTGYSDQGHTVDLFSYAEFESIDNNDKYRMMDISARSSNRDGAALRFVAEQLVKRPEEVKILILVSDGQPADFGYNGTAAEEDLRGIKQEYRRKGILFVAAAIGDDKRNIERIYGDSFMDITDLNQLPVKLTSVVKRHMRF